MRHVAKHRLDTLPIVTDTKSITTEPRGTYCTLEGSASTRVCSVVTSVGYRSDACSCTVHADSMLDDPVINAQDAMVALRRREGKPTAFAIANTKSTVDGVGFTWHVPTACSATAKYSVAAITQPVSGATAGR